MYAIHRYVNVAGETPAQCRRVLSTEVLGVLALEEFIGFQHAIREERVAELAAVNLSKDGEPVECYL